MGAIKATTKKRSDTTIPYWEVDQSLQDKTLETYSVLMFYLLCCIIGHLHETGFLPSSRPVGRKPRRRGETQTTATWAATLLSLMLGSTELSPPSPGTPSMNVSHALLMVTDGNTRATDAADGIADYLRRHSAGRDVPHGSLASAEAVEMSGRAGGPTANGAGQPGPCRSARESESGTEKIGSTKHL